MLLVLIIQIIFGAFVAGLKAGFIMNTYPLMAGSYLHPSIGRAFSEMGVFALTDHMVTVQFMHRNLAIILVAIGIFTWFKFRKNISDVNIRITLNMVVIVFSVQFLLGVLTLIYVVPVWLGVFHQFGAIVLLAVIIHLMHSLKYFSPNLN